jgi:hypothetical protein
MKLRIILGEGVPWRGRQAVNATGFASLFKLSLTSFPFVTASFCQRRTGVPLTCNAYFPKSKVRLARLTHYVHKIASENEDTLEFVSSAGDRIIVALTDEERRLIWTRAAAMSLTRLSRHQGKVQQARELLAPVYGWFTEGFDTRVLKEAKALLQELA